MKKKFLSTMLLSCLAMPMLYAGGSYGLPDGIQQGNILHCFNWTIQDVRSELEDIAGAGFGSVQLSPLQRNVSVGDNWSDAYRPYDFKFIASGLGTVDDLRDLCAEAETYGIKIIVDVVANHVDGHGAGDHSLYHDSWWNSNNRLRWNGNVDYSNRYSITHNQMGGGSGYPDVDSENPEVAVRAKSYIEELKSYGVKGVRWDAAKHIALPSEGCGFWSAMTSVPDMYYYGEVLDNPGGPNSDELMVEYTGHMSVTDNGYGESALNADGAPSDYGGWATGLLADDKVVYWGESHDTYSNNGGSSKYISQEQVDRAYAIVACRRHAAALYLSRPSERDFNNIKLGVKGSTQFKSASVAEVNKFRNIMASRADYYSLGDGAASVTRDNGGAVVVKRGGGGYVSVANGGGYCPDGTYTDRVSGGQFVVTRSSISGNVGPSGIAVIYSDDLGPVGGDDGDNDDGDNDGEGDVTIYYDNSITRWPDVNIHYWSTPSTEWPGVRMTYVKDDVWKYTFPAGVSKLSGFLFCDGTGANGTRQTADFTALPQNNHIYKGAGGHKGSVLHEGEYFGVTTALSDIDASDKWSVTTAPGTIVIDDAAGKEFMVAGMDGRLYHSGMAASGRVSVRVSAGIYIVRVAGRSVKVVVR